jgi:Carboxypeptidase regulatory-like domain
MRYALRSGLNRIALILAVLGLCAGMVWAQGGTGELDGLVTDSTGAVVADAPVVLTNIATGDKRTATTTTAGTYRFVALPVVGSYTLEVTAKGFKGYKISNIIVSVGTVTNHDVKLEVGTTSEEVTVEAGAQLVQTTESSLSGLVDRHVWQDMPLETRSQNEFIELLAGAEPSSVANLGTDRGAAVNGARSGTGNFLVDGFDNNDQGLGGGGSAVGPGGANTTISPDAIQEYRVIEHIPPAEYGKAGGFVTDTVLKGGTNQWHGSLFEYNRIQALAANSWFSDATGEQDHLVRNQFGGSFGGPIVKDKTFFFFTVEDHHLRTSSPITGNTMTTDFVNFVDSGAFETFQESDPNGFCVQYTGSACPGAFASSSTLGPIFSAMQNGQKMPLCDPSAANCSSLTNLGQGLWTTGFDYPVPVYGTVTVPQPQTINQLRYTAKVDQKLSSKDQLSGTYIYDNADSNTAYAGGDNTLGPALPNHTRAQNAGVTWSHTFSPTVLNQARMSFTRHTGNFPGDPTVAGFPSVVTAFDEPTFAYGNSSSLPQFFTENEFVYKDDLSVTHGKHNFKFGGEYRRTRNGSSFDANKNGLFLPYDVEDLVTDLHFGDSTDNILFGGPAYGSIYYAEASIDPQTNQLPVYYRGFRANEFAGYGQDDWRVNSRLTLNLGLRWEYFGPPHNFQPNIDANFYTGATTTPFATTSTNPFMPVNNPFYAGISTGADQLKNSNIWNKDTNNFGPRVGFAFDVMGNQKLVVRGGYGVTYDRMYNNIFENIRFNPPLFAFSVIGAFGNGVPIGATSGAYTAPFTSTAAFGGSALTASIRAMDQNLVTAYYEQANLGFEYQLGKDFVLESNYVGTFGHKLLGIIGGNTFDGRYACSTSNPSAACIAAGYPHGFTSTPINTMYSNISLRENCCSSNYNAWQTTLKKRFTGGLQFNINYTYSKALDDISDAFTTKNASGSAYPTDSENVNFDYGPADFDVRHRVVGGFNYDLPFAKGNRWIGGWGVSGIVSVQSGSPFSITSSASTADSNKDNQKNDRASYIGSGSILSAINHNVSPADGYLKASDWAMPGTSALPCPATVNMGLWCEGAVVGQMQRNSIVGPGYFNTDLGVSKAFRITESTKLTFYGNFFNVFNHPNFKQPDDNLTSGTFGESIATFDPRVTQLALRFDF